MTLKPGVCSKSVFSPCRTMGWSSAIKTETVFRLSVRFVGTGRERQGAAGRGDLLTCILGDILRETETGSIRYFYGNSIPLALRVSSLTDPEKRFLTFRCPRRAG